MGPPLHIMNRTKKEYIRLNSCCIDSDEVNEMLSIMLKLFISGKWSSTDDITAKNIDSGIEQQQEDDNKYLEWVCVQ